MNKYYMFADGFKVQVGEYRNLDFGQKIDLQMIHGAFVRYDSTRLKGNIAIVDDDGEFVYDQFLFYLQHEKFAYIISLTLKGYLNE